MAFAGTGTHNLLEKGGAYEKIEKIRGYSNYWRCCFAGSACRAADLIPGPPMPLHISAVIIFVSIISIYTGIHKLKA